MDVQTSLTRWRIKR